MTLRLSLERRPKRAQSSQAFLSQALPAVMQAAQSQEPGRLDQALERLHNACVECHRVENVLYFRTTVDRIRENAKIPILLGHGFWGFSLRNLPYYAFWGFAHEARTDFALLLGSLFLLIVGAGAWSLDAVVTRSVTHRP